MSTIPVMIPWLGEEEAEAAAAAVRSGWVAQGPRVAAFERAFAEHLGVPHAVAVSSCTTALHLAMIGAGVGPGDEVVVPSLSFIATANAVTYVGATPVFADVDPATGNLTPDTVAPLLTERTRAVVAVDQGGVPVDLDAIAALVEPRGITVVQDAACAAGSVYRGRPAGAGAELAAYSFHPRKLLTTGEGGMVTCRDGELAARLRRLREHGMSVSAADRHAGAGGAGAVETYDEIGYNHRMTDVQAAIGLVQLGKLPAMTARRRELAARYRELLGAELAAGLVGDPAHGSTNFQSLWLLLPAGAPDRGEVLARLAADGVSARRGIMAAHLEAPYKGTARVPLPVTETLTARTLILPLYHSLTHGQQEHVVAALKAALGR
ncbi:DegT/DnrJ/EryC1/StrS family aminotransferase [Kitasatospora sp. YST-16]|uniref:DegT/DnrJ/EryC1/StrS family aminotransferase n=1 Tax=Kitasatospora TaxID=2063 RepID=UPI0022851CC8|nr:DegT/DnrJ/EryC1/StrS family aminotransferase [Kitasatospora sp. YST-16]WAL73532.1 DegT/DnrJ/EryC1/StrS family aminotransferase [Kitasatospora sp. YST-16]WNW39588.1 DegT/DnrJ/EryC1/StrS family aminotransferase [Streptomyces sp. Li-HN-5-13]